MENGKPYNQSYGPETAEAKAPVAHCSSKSLNVLILVHNKTR